jgi:hypothetical protein
MLVLQVHRAHHALGALHPHPGLFPTSHVSPSLTNTLSALQIDLSDLYDTLAFFRGGLAGTGAHDHLAQKIASAGKEWSETLYRREDITAYHFR